MQSCWEAKKLDVALNFPFIGIDIWVHVLVVQLKDHPDVVPAGILEIWVAGILAIDSNEQAIAGLKVSGWERAKANITVKMMYLNIQKVEICKI